MVRRVRSAAKTCGAGAGFVTDVNKWVNKIVGTRVSKAKPTEADPAGTSASQQSFDMKLDHFEALIGILEGEPLYNPSTSDLKVASLQTKFSALQTANDAVKAAVVPLNNAVIARDKELYMEKTGLVIVEQLAKDEVRGTFGFSSPEYKLVSKIKFARMKKIPYQA